MIVITGATGTLGSLIVERLLARVSAQSIGVSVRDVSKAAELAERGVRVRQGDFTEPATLLDAMEGADTVLVVSAAIRGGGAAAANAAAIDAAVAAGAGRVLYTSHQAASKASLFVPQHAHAATEEHLAGLDIPFVALRHGFYASTLDFVLGDALQTGQLIAPQDGPVSWTTHADLAEVAAAALLDAELFRGATPPLAAPDQLDLEAVAAMASELTGRTITRVVADDEDWKAAAINAGMPAPAADFLLGMYRASRRGEFAVTDPTLERILGRPATPVRTVLEQIIADRPRRADS